MINLNLSKKLARLLEPKPIKVIIGGRGSGKSIGVGDLLTTKMLSEKADIYCLREYQDSINDSVHRVFKDSIEKRLNLEGWTIQENKVVAPNGAITTYRGAARNPDSIQSAQNYKYSWFEEAHRASKASLDKLLPTILRNPGAECWFTANPQSSADAFSERFINPYLKELERDGYYEDEIHIIIVVNWRDNPWWNKEQELLRAWDYENRPRNEYDWIWEGKFNDAVEDSIILPEWIDASIDAHLKLPAIARGEKRIGFDVADEGKDDKAVAVIHGGYIEQVYTWSKGDIDDGVQKTFELALEHHINHIIYDGIGVGAGVKALFNSRITAQNLKVIAFIGSESPRLPRKKTGDVRNEDLFKNLRAQTYWQLRERFKKTYNAIKKGEYIDPIELISLNSKMDNLNALRSELLRISRKRTSNSNMIQITSKYDMLKSKIPSPNMADALMMALSDIIPQYQAGRTRVRRTISGRR